jgi:hypothetical protein
VEDLVTKPVEAMTDEELFMVTKKWPMSWPNAPDWTGRASPGLTGKHVQAMSDMEFFTFLKEVLAALVKRAGPEGAVRKVLAGKEIETMSDRTCITWSSRSRSMPGWRPNTSCASPNS